MKHRGRRRTLYSLLGALGLAATVFLYFQLFSIEMMDFHQRESELPEFRKKGAHLRLKNYQRKGEDVETDKPQDRHSDDWKSHHEDDCDSADCDDLEKKLRIGKRIGKQLPIARHNAAAALHEQNYLNGDSIEGLPQGAKKELASLYKPNDQNMFICLESKEMISFEWVNDDYCDCSDGSDEPGTSACLDNRFYCTFQGGFKKDIPSGRVNDGICDCCDGSDEWMKRMLPKQVKIDDKPHYGYYQAPCVNRCDQEVRQAKQVSSIHQQGAALKQKYIQAAKGQSNPNWLYGPNGEFFTLSRNCYEIKPDKYEYKVCPFKEIRQQVFPEASTLIGQVPEWLEQGENGHWILKMSAGDSKQCPGGARRLSFLKFECGLSDNIVSVQETEVCQYTIQFSTPAAC